MVHPSMYRPKTSAPNKRVRTMNETDLDSRATVPMKLTAAPRAIAVASDAGRAGTGCARVRVMMGGSPAGGTFCLLRSTASIPGGFS